MINVTLQTTTGTDNDDTLLYQVTYNRHRQAQAISNLNTLDHWTPFLGFTELTSISDTRNLRKGDMACLCTDYGRVSQKMLEFQAEKYWNYQQKVAANPNAATDPELATGQLLFVMGQSYYYKISQFVQNVENWTKTQSVSFVAHGLSKLSPLRNTADDSPNIIQSGSNNSISNINLRYPRVDMFFQSAAWVNNGTSHLDSGDVGTLADNGAAELMIAEVSADEHRILNEFFQQSAAISTVKLLDIAQGWTPTTGTASHPGSGPIMLTATNYVAQGNVNYTVNKTNGTGTVTHSLSALAGGTSAGSLWSQVTAALTGSTYGSLTTVFITPGPITASGQNTGVPYTGMGAFVIGAGVYGAYITDNTIINNGGYGGDNGYTLNSDFPTTQQIVSTILVPTSDGGYTAVNAGNLNAGSSISLGEVTFNDYSTYTTGLNNNTIYLSADQIAALNAWNQSVSMTTPVALSISGSVTAAADIRMAISGNTGSVCYNGNMSPSDSGGVGIFGSIMGGLGAAGQGILDPVNAITGEFYVNALDIKLNGPMPLEIRRVYGSLNQADNNFGHGWRMSYFPYMMLSSDSVISGVTVTTQPTLIYAAEMDGSVIAYHRQSTPNTRWIPLATDNPNLVNAADGTMGGLSNLFNNRIDQTTVSGTTVYNLTGADGSVRKFNMQTFPSASGSSGITRTRPYLQTWTDNRGNSYTFTSGTNSTSPDYGLINRVQSTNGDFVEFYYDTYGHITEAFTKDGEHLYYQYDSYGDLIQVTLPDASKISYAYQHSTTTGTNGIAAPYSTHLITQETKPGGRILQNTYSPTNSYANRQVVTQLATVGTNETPVQNGSFSYTVSGTNSDGTTNGSTTITDVNGNTTTYTYTSNQITQINTPPQNNGSSRQNIFQTWFNNPTQTGYYQRSLQSRTDKRNLTSSYQYDSLGNLSQIIVSGTLTGDAGTQSGTTLITYKNSTSVTLPGSGISTIPNTITSITDPIGNSINYSYADTAHPYLPTSISKATSSGTVSTMLRQYQDVSGTSASAFGLLQLETIAAKTVDQAFIYFTNNANGFPTSKTQYTGTGDPDVVTYYTYNLRGEMTSETDVSGRNTQYSYDARGNRTSAERYDEWGNLVSWNFIYYNQNGEVEWEQGPRYSPSDYLT